jgi:chromosomal replication initiation ATPase DnaA
MVSKDNRHCRKRYRNFVEKGIEAPLDNPLKKTCGGTALGENRFIKSALEKVKSSVLQNREISHRRELLFSVSEKEVKTSNGIARNMAIYLLKKLTSIRNNEIGNLFGGLRYSAVPKANTKFSQTMISDRKIRRGIQEIARNLSQVKADPIPSS